jgi:hypothetical protein
VSAVRTPVPPSPPGPPRPAQAGAGRFGASSRTTPGRYRLWSIAAVVVLALATLTATASAAQMRSSSRHADTHSGPVLVATQRLLSSIAEADAAASAAFLSGPNEDPEQRRLYEEALARADGQVADIASLAGDDAGIRTVLAKISVQLTQYSGLVEAARASNRAAVPAANGYLTAAVQQADQLVNGDVAALATATQADLQHDQDNRARGFALAVVAMVLALAVLAIGQAVLFSRSKRLFNLPLAAATLLVLAALVWLVRANQTSADAIARARKQGYDSIVATTTLGRTGFGAKAAETLAVITGDPSQRATADADARSIATAAVTPDVVTAIRDDQAHGAPGGLIGSAATSADSPRERAAVADTAVRWQRYEGTSAALRAAPGAAAKAIAEGPLNSDFNGFNFSLGAILGQNQGQFQNGLASAANDTSRVPTAMLLLLVVAIGGALWGFQLRINDYR